MTTDTVFHGVCGTCVWSGVHVCVFMWKAEALLNFAFETESLTEPHMLCLHNGWPMT